MSKKKTNLVKLDGKPFEKKKPSIMMGRPISRNPMWENQLKFQEAFLSLAQEGYGMYGGDLESIPWWLKHHSSARNNIVVEFLKRKECDYLVWIDDDMTFINLAEDIKKAIELDKDMVMGICSCKPVPHFPNVGKIEHLGESGTIVDCIGRHVYDFPLDEPFEADYGSFGFVVMKRKVCEAMEPPWFYFPPCEATKGVWGEDVTFCFNAKMHGFELWVDPTIRLGHLGYTAWHHTERATHWLDFKGKSMDEAKKEGWDCTHNLDPEVQKVFKSAPGIKRMFV